MKIRTLKKKIKTAIRKSKKLYDTCREWQKAYGNLIWARQWSGVNWTTFRKTKSWSKSTTDDTF